MKAGIWIGIGLAVLLLGYTVWAMFIKKDAENSEDFKGGGYGFTPGVSTKTSWKTYM